MPELSILAFGAGIRTGTSRQPQSRRGKLFGGGTFDEEPEGQFLEVVKFALAVVAAIDHKSTDVTEVFVLTTIYPADLRRGPGLRVSPRGRGRGIPDWGSGRAFI